MADLLTVSEYKAMAGIQPADTRDDVQIASLLGAVSRMIRTFSGRQFEVSTGIAATRTYLYDGSGVLDIDDCTTVTSVTTDYGVPGQVYDLDSAEWIAMPQTAEVTYYLVLLGSPTSGRWSGEMGFKRNLDTYEFTPRMPSMNVTATWGWAAIPEDVKLAAFWTMSDFMARPGGEQLTSEAIAGYSRSWGRGGTAEVGMAIPNRARDVLAAYTKISV